MKEQGACRLRTVRSFVQQVRFMEQNLLDMKHLHVSFFTDKGEVRAVNDVSLTVPPGRIVGIVGESGCGKSVTARSVMRLIRKPGKITGGEILFEGRDLASLPEKELASLRGSQISMIFQDPMTSLNPVIRVGRQVEEALKLHTDLPKTERDRKVLEIFQETGISEPQKRLKCYPHELSGGLRQRVMIAMAMICRPKLLLADEPTTALDVTVEAQILRLMKKLRDAGTSILIISHNLGVIAQLCDYVYVMYAGRIVEEADITTLFRAPVHPYTKGLLQAVSSLYSGNQMLDTIPGVVPNLLHLPKGCSFSLRCSRCESRCPDETPEMKMIGPGHGVRCFLAGNGLSEGTSL